MDNSMEKRGSNGNANFNNMTDEQLQQWHTAFLTEAQRENYVNHNLEIVRHYRTEAIARAPAFDIERNAISAAIARHGLWMPPPPNSVAQSESSPQCTMTSTAAAAAASSQEEGQPPPQRRPRIEQPQTQQQQQQLPCDVAASRGSVSGASASNYGHYVALAHIFSDTYATRAEPVNGIINNVNANANANTNANRNNSNNNADDDREDSNINEVALTETIDSLGLRRT
ncbi:myb-like protein AA [Drosophila nasuta]|uniref:myb-like protein AA n=1 Tax=Drosophila nasuta TaxID=42062 RepID=UPI00295E26FC|nr:myb-like protein AA [Drosophila nasuta]